MKPLRLYLVRHGETAWAATGQHTGRTDIPLNAKGEEEAKDLGHRIREVSFDRVLVSPRIRAQRTCELADIGVVPTIEPGLAEWDYGDFEGLTSAEIVAANPGWNVYRDGCPNGESADQVAARADQLIGRLRNEQGDIALFSHGQFGAVLAARWIEGPVQVAQHFPLGTASLSVLGYARHHPEIPVIQLWNSMTGDIFG